MVCTVPINTGIPTSYQAINIHEYTGWSLFNIFCCGLFCGIFAFLMSRETQKRKMLGDIKGARSASACTVVLNIIASFTGLTAFVIGALYRFEVFTD